MLLGVSGQRLIVFARDGREGWVWIEWREFSTDSYGWRGGEEERAGGEERRGEEEWKREGETHKLRGRTTSWPHPR